MPSSVHCASLRSSSLPVAMVKVSGSISRSDCGRPCRLQAKSTSRRATSSLRSAVFAMPVSSMVSAITAAPNCFASFSRSVACALAVLEVDRVDDRLAAMQLQRRRDHRRLGAVDHQRRVHRRGEAAHHLGHLARSRRGRQTRCRHRARWSLRPTARAPSTTQPSQSCFSCSLAPLLRAVGVAALADGEERVLLPQRHRLVQAGDRRHPHRLAQHRRRAEAAAPAQHRVQRGDMLRVGAAAAADQVDAVLARRSAPASCVSSAGPSG